MRTHPSLFSPEQSYSYPSQHHHPHYLSPIPNFKENTEVSLRSSGPRVVSRTEGHKCTACGRQVMLRNRRVGRSLRGSGEHR